MDEAVSMTSDSELQGFGVIGIEIDGHLHLRMITAKNIGWNRAESIIQKQFVHDVDQKVPPVDAKVKTIHINATVRSHL